MARSFIVSTPRLDPVCGDGNQFVALSCGLPFNSYLAMLLHNCLSFVLGGGLLARMSDLGLK